jgi:hypothetical protein
MLVDIRFETNKLTQKQIAEINALVPFSEFCNKVEEKPVYSSHMRDMTKGWIYVGNVKEYKESMGPFKPGTYALVYNANGKIDNPVTWNQTLMFGETTQGAYKRILCHTGALRGKVTNMTEKWNKNIPKLNKIVGGNIRNHLQDISIFFRPHDVTDPDFEEDRNHSCHMEKQAHAQYHALWNRGTMFNTRDLPGYDMIRTAKKLMEKTGRSCSYPGY